ncbi:MAG: hypothetical protein ACPG3U_07325 [Rhodothermales bacterium]
MDVVQFLFAVVNLLLALVVLLGGRLIFDRLTKLREDVEALKHRSPDETKHEETASSMHWKE